MKKYFEITTRSKIYIYGYTVYARSIAQKLSLKNYVIDAYLDKEASSFKKTSDIVMKPNFSNVSIQEKENRIIIICLQNISQHVEVAEKLHIQGFNKIVFLAVGEQFEQEEASRLRKCYQAMDYSDDTYFNKLPLYTTVKKNKIKYDAAIIKKIGNYICLWIPKEILYTGFQDNDNAWLIKDNKYSNVLRQFENKNITLNKLYIDFFESLSHGTKDYEEYINIYSVISGKEKKEYFLDRKNLYQIFKIELNKGLDFFIETAAKAVWNCNGYFNLVDGHHRVTFLCEQGYVYIPIIISTQDYNIYMNSIILEQLITFLEKKRIKKLATPLPSPAFYGFPVQYENCGNTILEKIQKYLNENTCLNKKTVLDISMYQGYFARNALRMGAKKSSVVSQQQEEKELVNLLNKIQYLDNIEILDYNLFIEQQEIMFDIVYEVGLLNHNEKEQQELLKILDNITREYLIVETKICTKFSGESMVEKTHFKTYEKIISLFNGDYVCEIGILRK